jgi:hypothetical protein
VYPKPFASTAKMREADPMRRTPENRRKTGGDHPAASRRRAGSPARAGIRRTAPDSSAISQACREVRHCNLATGRNPAPCSSPTAPALSGC